MESEFSLASPTGDAKSESPRSGSTATDRPGMTAAARSGTGPTQTFSDIGITVAIRRKADLELE